MRHAGIVVAVLGLSTVGASLASAGEMPAHWMNYHPPYLIYNRYWYSGPYGIIGPTDIVKPCPQPVNGIGPPPFGPRCWYQPTWQQCAWDDSANMGHIYGWQPNWKPSAEKQPKGLGKVFQFSQGANANFNWRPSSQQARMPAPMQFQPPQMQAPTLGQPQQLPANLGAAQQGQAGPDCPPGGHPYMPCRWWRSPRDFFMVPVR